MLANLVGKRRTRVEPQRILLVGFYGCGVAGDEAILHVVARDLRERYPGVRLAVTTGDPDLVPPIEGVDPVDFRDLNQVKSAIAAADLVVLGGGGLFSEYPRFRPLCSLKETPDFNALYAEVPALAAACGVPSTICAAGVEPLRSAEARAATQRAFALATTATVRDSTSIEALDDLGGLGRRAVVTCDPAVALEPRAYARASTLQSLGLDPDQPVVSLSLRHWDPQPLRLSEAPQEWEDAAAGALNDFCAAHRAQLLFVPLEYRPDSWIFTNDILFFRRFSDRFGDVPRALWTSELSPEAVAGAIALGDVSLAMRHHGVIFATTAGVPCVAMAYATKVAGAMRDAGLGRFVLSVGGVSTGALSTALEGIWQEAPSIRKQLRIVQRRRLSSHNKTLDIIDAALRRTDRSDREVALAQAANRWLQMGLDRQIDPALSAALDSLLHWAFSATSDPLNLRQPVATLRARFPDVAAVAYYYGHVEAVAGEHLDAAVAALSQAIAAGFAPAWARFNRAQVHLRRGDMEAARTDLEAALLIDPTIAAAREQLESLTKTGPVESSDA